MERGNWWLATAVLVLLGTCPRFSSAVELTFELPDNAKECFYEDIEKGTESSLEFQVVTGGHYDVDVILEGPSRQILYREIKQQYGQFQFTPEHTGTYQVCFSNEFSTFSHKLIYVDFQVGDEPQLPGVGDHYTAMTQMESSSQKIHENLNSILDYQTHHRLREAQGRKRAEDLNERVLFWAMGETLGILVIAVGQVMILKNFFADKKSNQASY
ncbi:transmembrane emp24 domain-containing protein 7-like [Macrobrachium nipponense]|uniref:transmembrane emp24 domain-containing protein 7-like n=1 Tax=Macrobrachium nipponense TaxID=159736 RepID=UPI0030C7B5B5